MGMMTFGQEETELRIPNQVLSICITYNVKMDSNKYYVTDCKVTMLLK